LPQLFALFKEKYPEIQISIYRNFSKKVVDKILENQLDFGIVTLPVPDRDLHVMPIAEDELWLIKIGIYRNFSKKVVDKILENQLDFGIVTLPVPDRDLHVMPIAEDELWLI